MPVPDASPSAPPGRQRVGPAAPAARSGARALQRRAAGVIREEGAGRYYLYAPAYAPAGRRIAIAMICVIVAMSGSRRPP